MCVTDDPLSICLDKRAGWLADIEFISVTTDIRRACWTVEMTEADIAARRGRQGWFKVVPPGGVTGNVPGISELLGKFSGGRLAYSGLAGVSNIDDATPRDQGTCGHVRDAPLHQPGSGPHPRACVARLG